jgi:flagellar biosynthesis protein FlhB
MFLAFLLPFMGVYLLIASADYFLQRFLFMRDMKMTKDEVKREYKQQEGSPEIKGQRKSLPPRDDQRRRCWKNKECNGADYESYPLCRGPLL